MFTMTSRVHRVARPFVSAVVCVLLLALGLALNLSGSIASAQISGAQISGGLPDWVTLLGTFEQVTESDRSDMALEYRLDGQKDWSAIIEWGIIGGMGHRGTSGSWEDENAGRKLCHGPDDVDLNVVQFELTWRNKDADGFVPCSDLTALFGATLSVRYPHSFRSTQIKSHTCDIVYSVYFGPGAGALVDCLTTNTEAPSPAPRSLRLLEVAESEAFSMARVSRGFVKSGSNDKVEIRLADSMNRPLTGYHVGVDIYAGPSYDSNSGLPLKCDNGCIVSKEGYIYISYDVASISESSQQNVDYIKNILGHVYEWPVRCWTGSLPYGASGNRQCELRRVG